MQILHVADTHLGFQAYRSVDEEGFNLRESDVYDAFERAVDHAVERDVDLVLHAGDLFDSVRPSNRAIGQALDQLRRLRKAQIPVVVVAGNHETPRMKETGHVFRVLEHFDGVTPLYRGAESVDVAGVTVHAVPHVPTQDDFEAELDELAPTGDGNVLALHGTTPGIEGLPTGEFNDLTIPPDVFDPFDYVALGHYHVRTRVAERAWYAGSLERLTFAEADVDKGCLLVDPKSGDVEPLDVPARPMVQETIDCGGLDGEGVEARLGSVLDRDLDGALVKVKLEELTQDVYQALDLGELKAQAAGAVHVELAPDVVRRDVDGSGEASIGALADEFGSYLSQVPVDDLDKKRLAQMARSYLKEAQDAPS